MRETSHEPVQKHADAGNQNADEQQDYEGNLS